MYSPVFEIWKCKENQFVSQVASAENHLAFVVAAVNRVINRTNPDPDPQTFRLTLPLTLTRRRRKRYAPHVSVTYMTAALSVVQPPSECF